MATTGSAAGPPRQIHALIPSIPQTFDPTLFLVYPLCMPPTKATLPTMDSPVAALRGDELQRTFAHRVGISRMALLRLEQGLLPEPSTKLIPYLPSGLTWANFVEDYHAYQEAKRIANFGVLYTDPDFDSPHYEGDHPLTAWMQQSANNPSLTTICVALCLHLPSMHRFVNGPFPYLPPDVFLDALVQSGYSREVVSDFVMSYSEWRAL